MVFLFGKNNEDFRFSEGDSKGVFNLWIEETYDS